MSNAFVNEIKGQKKLLLSLVGLVAVILVGSTLRYGSGFELGGLNTYPGTTGGSNFTGTNGTSGTNNTVSNPKYNKYTAAPLMKLKNGVDYRANIETTVGTFTVDIFEKDTPVTVNNFVFLANDKYYNDLLFHYIKKGTLIQTGDPLANGSGGPGYKFKDEIDAVSLGLDKTKVKDAAFLARLYDQLDKYTAPFSPENLKAKSELSLKQFYEQDFGFTYSSGIGTYKVMPYYLAMANGGPGSNGSQFFITTKGFNDQSISGRHTVFGKVITGMDIVDKIEATSTNANGKPTKDVRIVNVQIIEM
jgi:peptidyl-prolyl cis-trans isomerase A (cyclophilin A)